MVCSGKGSYRLPCGADRFSPVGASKAATETGDRRVEQACALSGAAFHCGTSPGEPCDKERILVILSHLRAGQCHKTLIKTQINAEHKDNKYDLLPAEERTITHSRQFFNLDLVAELLQFRCGRFYFKRLKGLRRDVMNAAVACRMKPRLAARPPHCLTCFNTSPRRRPERSNGSPSLVSDK